MASPKRLNAEEVGYAFKDQYYHFLQNFPEFVHGFYEDSNKIPRPQTKINISRPQLDGTMRLSTLSDIDDKDLKMLTSGGFDSVEVTSVMSQDSKGGGLIVFVHGYFISKDGPARNFVQSFFLAPQDTGYFVLNDMFRFVDLPPKANGLENDFKISFGSVGQGQDSAEIKADSVDDSRNGNSEVYLSVVAEGEGICIQNFPLNVTIGLVREVLKKFGSIKRFTVRSVKNYCDCLVEFEEADAAEKIIKASPLLIDGHISQVEKKLPYCASLSEAELGDIERGEEVRESKDNPFRDTKKIMEVVRGTDVWEKLTMRGTRVYEVRNWEKIMDQLDTAIYDYEKLDNLAQELTGILEEITVVLDEEEEKQKLENLREEERKKIEEEEVRQYKQSRYRSQQMKETQGLDQIKEEEEEEQNDKGESKLQEEEGRQYNQNRFGSKKMKEETPEVCQFREEKEEEHNEKVESKFQDEAEETEVDFSWTHDDIMEFHRKFEGEDMKKIQEEEGPQYKQSRYGSEQMKETQGVCEIQGEVEEEDQNEKDESKLQEVDFSWSYEEIMEVHRQFEEELMKIEEEEGRQYNQNRYRSPVMKETQEIGQIPEEEEETEKVESKLQKEAEEKEVDFSWTYEQIMEEHRVFEEEDEEAFTYFCKRMKMLEAEQQK